MPQWADHSAQPHANTFSNLSSSPFAAIPVQCPAHRSLCLSRSGGRNMQIWPRTSLIHPASVGCCLRTSCLRAWMSASNSSFPAFLALICFTCDNTSRRAIRLTGFIISQLQVATHSAQSPRAQRLAPYTPLKAAIGEEVSGVPNTFRIDRTLARTVSSLLC